MNNYGAVANCHSFIFTNLRWSKLCFLSQPISSDQTKFKVIYIYNLFNKFISKIAYHCCNSKTCNYFSISLNNRQVEALHNWKIINPISRVIYSNSFKANLF